MNGLAKDGRSALNHELNRDGTACSDDCPACLYMRVQTPPEPAALWGERSQAIRDALDERVREKQGPIAPADVTTVTTTF
jgi:hypothetical protein